VLVGTLESRAWVAVGVTAVLAVLGSLVSAAQDWHPPGPIFLVSMAVAGAVLRRQHSRPRPLAGPRRARTPG